MRSKLRAPFVVTAAVLATMSAHCDADSGDAPTRDASLADAEEGETSSDARENDGDGDADADGRTDAPDTANPEGCPSTDPGLGAAKKPCAVDGSIRCIYPDLCAAHPAGQTENVYLCFDDGSGDHWTLVSKPYVPACPEVEPKTGDPCPCTIHMGYVACNYGDCEAFTRTYAACKGVDTFDSTWTTVPIVCNPPEVDGGTAAADATD